MSTRRRVTRRILATTGVLLLFAIAFLVGRISSGPRVGQWASAEVARDYAAAYSLLEENEPPTHTRSVTTSFGIVHLNTWEADNDDTPVLLLPGRSSGSPMWMENLPSWIGQRTIYAPDPIGDAGLSTQSVPLTSQEDQATWIAETLEEIGVNKAHVVGHSFGGANATALAQYRPDLVASLTLLEPVIVIKQLPVSMFFWATLTQLPVPQSLKDRALAEIGGTTVEEIRARTPMSEMIDIASSGYNAALPQPVTLDDADWSSLAVPLRVDIGGESTLAGGEAAAERIRALVPDAEVTVWPGATHSLPMDEKDALGEELLEFWNSTTSP